MKTIFEYSDYRSFMKDYLSERQDANGSFSMGKWAKLLGMSSTSVLTNIINGNKNLGEKMANSFIEFFEFDDKEKQYFLDLVEIFRAKNDPQMLQLLKEKFRQKYGKDDFQLLTDEEYELFYSSWCCIVIREMISLPHFKEDYEWIADNLHFDITAQEVEKIVELLLRLGAIERDQNNRLRSAIGSTSGRGKKISFDLIKRNHQQWMQNGADILDKVARDEYSMSALTFNIKEKNVKQFETLIREFNRKAVDLLEDDAGDRTYQVNIQCFPVNKKVE